MALYKKTVSANGIPVEYHRIAAVHVIPSDAIIVEIGSYISKDTRQTELDAIDVPDGEPVTECNVLVEGSLENFPYSESLSIKDLYNQLKTLDKYKDSVDA